MTRQGDTGVTVAVRIRFMSQSRTTTPPTPPATTPRLGQLVGDVTEIPGGDPRRTWATDMMAQAVQHWNGRLTFVGVERNITRANTAKRLPVTFQAIPVFTAGEAANSQVIVHPSTSVGGSPGHPIDAGNFYERRNANVYPASEDIIYAHEYGHLLGIPDEYSQSNRQMHLLLHQSSPAGAATARAALDRTTVERMVLAALARPLNARLTASLPGVVAALQAQQPMLTTKMATAARTGVRDPGVATELRTRLEQSSEAALHPSVPSIAAFQTTTNFSPRTRATEGVAAEFASPALTSRIGDAYWSALLAPHEQNTAVAGLGDVAVIPATSAYGMGQGTGPVAAPAAGLATTAVGPVPAAGPGLPAVAPSTSLVGQLTALPATWATAGSAAQSAVTSAAFASSMQATLRAANFAAALGAILPGLAPQPRAAQIHALYRTARDIVTNASVAVARQIVADLLSSTITPVLTASVAALQSQVQTEVNRVMTTSAEGVAATGTPDPNMVAAVATMKARLEAAQAATAASTNRDPTGAGQAAPDQDVTYSYQGLMGTNRTTALRADQFAPMLSQFNSRLTSIWERNFTAEAR